MSVLDAAAVGVLRAGGAAIRLSPTRAWQPIGALMGRGMMVASAKRVRITRENIHTALPDLDVAEQEAIVRASYRNLGITLAELLAVPSLTRDELLARVDIPGFDAVLERKERRLPSIFLSAHYGNWEWLALAAGVKLGAPLLIVTHPQSNADADRLLNTYRCKFGNTVVPMGKAARPLVRTLSEGGTVAFLADQFAQWDKDPWISFFGRETPTYEAPAALALKFNAPIFYAFAERNSNGTYHAPIQPIAMDHLAYNRSGIEELTKLHVQILEEQVRKRPELWSWQHRRWRSEYTKPSPQSTAQVL